MQTLNAFLESQLAMGVEHDLLEIVRNVADATRQISRRVRSSTLMGLTGVSSDVNVQGEAQKPLDLLANEIMLRACWQSKGVSFAVSEELDEEVTVHPEGRYALIFDPLDGSSNLDVNVTVGTIFSVVAASSVGDILKKGREQLVAGYAAYGPQTALVITFGLGVQIFTLSEDDEYVMTMDGVTIPPEASEFAINVARRTSWDDVIASYVELAMNSHTHNMRWIGSMVADTHRILNRGGIFMYPADRARGPASGRLRLLYEANPIAYLIEAAGGGAVAGDLDILDIQPTSLHQRVPVIFGSVNEVEKLKTAYRATD